MSTFIDVNDDQQLNVWARILHVGPDQLVRLVSEHGPSVEHVREAIKRDEICRTAGRRPTHRR